MSDDHGFETTERQALREALRLAHAVDRSKPVGVGETRLPSVGGDAEPPRSTPSEGLARASLDGLDAVVEAMAQGFASIERRLDENERLAALLRELVAVCQDLTRRNDELAAAVEALGRRAERDRSAMDSYRFTGDG